MTRAQKKQATRVRILEAATELFNENGYEATDYAAIAKHAGVAYGTIYSHFKNKEYLLIEFYLNFLRRQLSLIDVIKPDGRSNLEQALYLMKQMWRFGEAYPNSMIRTFYSHNWHTDEETFNRVNETVAEVLMPIVKCLFRAQEDGEIADNIDLKMVMVLLRDSYLRTEMDGRFSALHKQKAIHMFDKKVAYLLQIGA